MEESPLVVSSPHSPFLPPPLYFPHQPRSLQKERRKRSFLGELSRSSQFVSHTSLSSLSDLTSHTPVSSLVLKPPGQCVKDKSGQGPHPLSSLCPLPALPFQGCVSVSFMVPALPFHPHYCLLPLPGELVLFFFKGWEECKKGNQRFCPRDHKT